MTMSVAAREVDPCSLEANELLPLLARGEISAEAAVAASIARIRAVDPVLRAVVAPRFEAALEEARALDRRRRDGAPPGRLHGLPVVLKESLDLAGTASTYGIPGRRDHRAENDEPHVARWRAAGAVIVAKTNVSQLLFSFECDNPLFGASRNPWDPERTPGGSTGGSAALIAAGAASASLGSDLGGSCRVPAAFCGIAGLKPTAGRMPDLGRGSLRIGQQAIPSQVGVLARSARDLALGLEVANASPVPLGDPAGVDLARLRFTTWIEDGVLPPCAAAVRAVHEAAEALRSRGATEVETELPSPAEALEITVGIFGADRFAGMARLLGKDPREKSVGMLELLIAAGPVRRAFLSAALRVTGRARARALMRSGGDGSADHYFDLVERQLAYRERYLAALGDVDLILSPATALPAVRHGATAELGSMGAYTMLYNLLGFPAGVVPVTTVRAGEQTAVARHDDASDRVAIASEQGSAGLPIAVQIAARPWQEHRVLAALAAVELPPGMPPLP
jgi:fatty acid amide hydrolase